MPQVNGLSFVCWSGCHWEDACEPQARVRTVPEPPGSTQGAGDPVGERGRSGKERIIGQCVSFKPMQDPSSLGSACPGHLHAQVPQPASHHLLEPGVVFPSPGPPHSPAGSRS